MVQRRRAREQHRAPCGLEERHHGARAQGLFLLNVVALVADNHLVRLAIMPALELLVVDEAVRHDDERGVRGELCLALHDDLHLLRLQDVPQPVEDLAAPLMPQRRRAHDEHGPLLPVLEGKRQRCKRLAEAHVVATEQAAAVADAKVYSFSLVRQQFPGSLAHCRGRLALVAAARSGRGGGAGGLQQSARRGPHPPDPGRQLVAVRSSREAAHDGGVRTDRERPRDLVARGPGKLWPAVQLCQRNGSASAGDQGNHAKLVLAANLHAEAAGLAPGSRLSRNVSGTVCGRSTGALARGRPGGSPGPITRLCPATLPLPLAGAPLPLLPPLPAPRLLPLRLRRGVRICSQADSGAASVPRPPPPLSAASLPPVPPPAAVQLAVLGLRLGLRLHPPTTSRAQFGSRGSPGRPRL
mmetsp:Transcript_88658/g.280569  ORF Transcript_88658/g.280569 Transcript_88658/m.280569 type:complete len:412 (+) Transcript_88658:635-1870(+)